MNEIQMQNAMRLHQAGKLAEAARIYGDILRASPGNFQALYLLGFVHFQQNEFEDAERLIGAATRLNPNSPDAYYNRGCALQKLERDEEAIECFERALALKPDYLEAKFNYGTSLLRVKRYAGALTAFESVVRATPLDAEAWHNRAGALLGLERTREAIACYGRALELAPESTKTLSKRGGVLMGLRCFEEAARDFEKVAARDPELEQALGNLTYSRLHVCDWRDFDKNRQAIDAALRDGKPVIPPLSYIIFGSSPELQRRCAQFWSAKEYPPASDPLWNGERYRHEKIRVGYVSADFRTHAVAFLIAGVIERHDRDAFEIIGISLGKDDDTEMRTRLKGAFDRFIDVHKATDREAAALMREHEVDIAVDLMGYTGGCRTGIFAQRPAPIQVNYLGFPGTMGTSFIDYIIADRIVIPEQDLQYFDEKVVYLPDTFQPNDAIRRVAETSPIRTAEGLPENSFVFCSFNNSCKILPETFEIWTRLLKAVDGSVLWLPEYFPAEPGNLKREAAARGIDPARLVFAKLVATPEEYLARLPLADLFLDTLPYNAHTTASDALWMGVPVLTRVGTTFAGRVAASVLTAIGLPELITQSAAEYEATALRLARDPAELAAIRTKLSKNRADHPLFDTRRYCRNLEAAYVVMWNRYMRGEPPTHVSAGPVA